MRSHEDFVDAVVSHIARCDEALSGTWPKRLFEAGSFPNCLDAVYVQKLARSMACFINMPYYTFLVSPDCHNERASGRIEWPNSGSNVAYISLSPELYRYPQSLIKVLAHEIAHQYMRCFGLEYPNERFNEEMTDVTSVYLGFGKYILNGDSYTKGNSRIVLGYLSDTEFAFVYDLMCKLRGISGDEVVKGLSPYAMSSLRNARLTYREINLIVRSSLLDYAGAVKTQCDHEDLLYSLLERLKVVDSSFWLNNQDRLLDIRKSAVSDHAKLRSIHERVVKCISSGVARSPVPYASEKELAGLLYAIAQRIKSLESLIEAVSLSIKDDDILAMWSSIDNLILECPNCRSRLRLPVGKELITVHCPRCKHTFDYSTTAPLFKEKFFKRSHRGTQHEFEWSSMPRSSAVPMDHSMMYKAGRFCRRNGRRLLLAFTVLLCALPIVSGILYKLNGDAEVGISHSQNSLKQQNDRPDELSTITVRELCEANWQVAKENGSVLECSYYRDKHIGSMTNDQELEFEQILAYRCRHPSADKAEMAALRKELPAWKCDMPNRNGVTYVAEYARKIVYGEFGCFRIKTSGQASYIVRFYDADTKAVVLDEFIQGGTDEDVWLPPGNYRIMYTCGREWYGDVIGFGLNASYGRVDKLFSLDTDERWEITLFVVEGGNLRTSKVDGFEFDSVHKWD